MTKEHIDIDRELEYFERELGQFFREVEPVPLDTVYKDKLRQKLEDALDKKQKKKLAGIPLYKNIISGLSAKAGLFNTSFLAAFGGKGSKKTSPGGKRLRLVASFALVALMFTGLFWGLQKLGVFLNPVNAAELTITALEQDKLGVSPGTSFLLRSKQPLDEKMIIETLKVTPAFVYDLEKGAGGKEYKIIPKQQLAVNTVYRLSFDPSGLEKECFSWAFQTKGVFRVVRTLPGDKTTYVPVNAGVEVAFSHENFEIDKIREYIEINPRVEGRFEKHKKTLVFVPKELKEATLYTVTVKKGFPLSQSAEVLADDYSFSFETAPSQDKTTEFTFDLGVGLTEFAREEAPVVPAFYNAKSEVPAVTVNVYKYPDAKAFINSLTKRDEIPLWSYYKRNCYREDLTGLNKVEEFKTEFLTADTYNHYVVFPRALPEGYYAAEIKAGETTRQMWFQVTDLAVFLTTGDEKALLWVNDLDTKAPVPDVEMQVESSGLDLKGDGSGVVLINKLPGLGTGEGKAEYALIKSGSRQVVVPLDTRDNRWYDKNSLSARDYWKYLYLDRELFRPGDEMHFWGIVSPRIQGVKEIKEVRIELKGGYGFYEGAEDTPILSRTVKVEGSTYTGSIKLPVLKPGYYYLTVKTDETVLLSRGFSVEIYEKPAYRLEINPEKKAVFAGEGFNFQAKAAFFEGTPVPELKLNYHINGKNGAVITDEKGIAKIPYIGRTEEVYSSYSYQYLGVSANLPEAGEITGSSQVYVFGSKVYLAGEVSRQGEAFTVRARLSGVDLSKINEGYYPVEENFITGRISNTLVKGSIYQNIWEKVETGEHYDFINKKVEKTYYYRHSAKHISDFSMITGESGETVYSGKLDPNSSYYLELSAEDNEGRIVKKRLPVPGSGQDSPNDYKYYHLKSTKEVKGYIAGDEVRVVFMENEQEMQEKKKSYLYFRGQKQIESYAVSDSPQYGFVFNEQNIPNVNVFGVYFDGRSYQQAAAYLAPFDRETRALRVRVETDKQEYRPGETVSLSLEVTNTAGKGVLAEVNLNLVDEALYSLRNQQADLLSSLYGDYIHTRFYTWKSHYHPQPGGGAEQGGEGDGERKDFRDTVLFVTLQTDKDGKARTEFKLPDNLTSWRVTYQALTTAPGLFAGSGTCQIPVRLPFFVEMTANDTCLEGDAPIVILRSYGEKLGSLEPVSYKMKLVSPVGEEIEAQGQGSAFTAYDWKLPALKTGRYTLTVEGTSNNLKDKITKEINVVETFLERTVSNFELLREDLQLEKHVSGAEPATVVFSDYEKTQYLQGLYRLGWQNGSRFEQQLAAREARRLLARYFPDEKIYYEPQDIDTETLLRYQQPDGGISILPYAESELKLTALAASCSGEDFDKKALAGYFYGILENGGREDDKSLALWGLAALNEPVLLQINNYLGEKELTPSEKINLVLASLDSGNGAAAQEVFRELIAQYGEDLGTAMRIKVGRDQDEIIEATTQMALLAARLEHPLKNKLYQYLLENQAKDTLNLIEQAIILKYNLQYMDINPVSFTYELNGQKTTETLKGWETLRLTLLPEDVSGLKFSNVQGKVGVLALYTGSYSAEEITPQQDLNISRFYRVDNRQVTALGRSDLVEVTISYTVGEKAPAGCYEIVDILPAGLRYVTRPYIRSEKGSRYLSYPTEVKGQKLTFAVGKGTDKITYYARVVSPGEYGAEPALLNNIGSSKISTLSGQDRIVIK